MMKCLTEVFGESAVPIPNEKAERSRSVDEQNVRPITEENCFSISAVLVMHYL